MMRIGQLASKSGISTKALRYYEARGLLKAGRNSAGYREFDERALEVVAAIRAGQKIGLGLDELRDVLEHVQNGVRPCTTLRTLIAKQRTEVSDRIAELKRFDAFLESLEEAEPTSDECPILARAAARVDKS